MRKSGSWIGAVVKRVFSLEPKEKKTQSEEQKTPKSNFRRKWGFGKAKPPDLDSSHHPETPTLPPSQPETPTLPPSQPDKSAARVGDVELKNSEPEENKNVYAAALATAEAAVAAAKAAAEVVRLTTSGKKVKSSEEEATIKIQMAIRGDLARRSLQVLRGSARLKSLIQSDGLKRQTANTLRCIQTVSKFQSQVRSRRLKMAEEKQKIEKHLQLKQEREVEIAKEAEKEEEVEWDSTQRSKEKVEASAISKQEAAVRRERAMAYAFSHQWKAPSRSISPMFTNPTNPQWGWSWLERWMVANRSTPPVKEKKHTNTTKTSIEGEVTHVHARRNVVIGGRFSPVAVTVGKNKLIRRGSGRHFPITTTPSISGGKIHSSKPRAGCYPIEYDTGSILSIRSERARQQSLAGSSVRDDDSLASSPAVPNYMALTESARARSRYLNSASCRFSDSGSTSSAKKRLSFPASDNPGFLSLAEVVRRHSAGPAPQIEISTLKDILSQPQDHHWP